MSLILFQESVYILISHCIFFLSWQHTNSSLWLNSYFKTLEYITIIWSNPGCKQEPFRGHVLHRDKTVSKYATPHIMFLSSIIYVVHIKIKNWNVRFQEAKDPPHALILLCHTWDRRPLWHLIFLASVCRQTPWLLGVSLLSYSTILQEW